MAKQEYAQVQTTRRERQDGQGEVQETPAEEATRDKRIESIVERLGTTTRQAELIHGALYDDPGL